MSRPPDYFKPVGRPDHTSAGLGLSAFVAHTWTHSIATTENPTTNATYNYYSLDKYTTDYALNTTTGNGRRGSHRGSEDHNSQLLIRRPDPG